METACCNTVASAMQEMGLKSRVCKQFQPTTTVADPDKRRIVLEGLLFRVREVLEELRPDRVLLAGGLAREPFVGRGLAALLDRPVEILDIHEAVLTGAARLAAGLGPHAAARTRRVEPGKAGGYLRSKYERWKRWLSARLAASAGALPR